eukprot:TRINITY_DN516_c0_g1_i1.p1 TRINITY_DN516_c0_g1~~TRINITY_DN516_c0_g1_i1.p1  ORF type:complete len:408 (-),score=117.52 TRINITY_DN516_c0_g1_i1:133-1356(-)
MGCLASKQQKPELGVSWFDSDGRTFRYFPFDGSLMFEEDEQLPRPIARGDIDWKRVPPEKQLDLQRLLEWLGPEKAAQGDQQKDVAHETKQQIPAGSKSAEAMDCKFLEACGSGQSKLTREELKKMCESMGCENIVDIGKAAEAMAAKLGGFEPVLGKLQKDVGDETWQNILKEYKEYSREAAPAAGGQGAGAMDCKFLEACGAGDSTLTPEELKKMCESMECESIGDIGKAAEAMAAKLGGFEPVLGKLQKDVGDETWQKILKEYDKYSGEGAPAAGDQGAGTMDCNIHEDVPAADTAPKRNVWSRISQRAPPPQSTMDSKFLEACGSGESTLTPEEMQKMCQSLECESIGEIGKAAWWMGEKLGGFAPVLEKLQKDVGDETWQKILKEYEKYSENDKEAAGDENT